MELLPTKKLKSVGEYKGTYPVAVLPKLGGYRCITGVRVALSSNMNPIPNRYVQTVLSLLPPGLDGEVTGISFSKKGSEPVDFTYHVLDCLSEGLIKQPWLDRMEHAQFCVSIFRNSHPKLANHVRLKEYKIASQPSEVKGCVYIREPNKPGSALVEVNNYLKN